MKKLKTLKDIEFGGGLTYKPELQEAAKEWIKELERKTKNTQVMEKEIGNMAIIHWIKHFFNLEETE